MVCTDNTKSSRQQMLINAKHDHWLQIRTQSCSWSRWCMPSNTVHAQHSFVWFWSSQLFADCLTLRLSSQCSVLRGIWSWPLLLPLARSKRDFCAYNKARCSASQYGMLSLSSGNGDSCLHQAFKNCLAFLHVNLCILHDLSQWNSITAAPVSRMTWLARCVCLVENSEWVRQQPIKFVCFAGV